MKVFLDGNPEELLTGIDENTDEYDPRSVQFTETKDNAIIPIMTPTEMGDAFNKLDADVLDNRTGMSSVDFNARLHHLEISAILILDFLVGVRFMSGRMLNLTRSKKRISVSINGEGRKEKVEIAQGVSAQKSGRGLFQRMGDVFTGGQK